MPSPREESSAALSLARVSTRVSRAGGLALWLCESYSAGHFGPRRRHLVLSASERAAPESALK